MSYRADIRVYHGNCTGDSVHTYLFLNGIVETSAVMGKRVLVKMSMIYRMILDKSGARLAAHGGRGDLGDAVAGSSYFLLVVENIADAK